MDSNAIVLRSELEVAKEESTEAFRERDALEERAADLAAQLDSADETLEKTQRLLADAEASSMSLRKEIGKRTGDCELLRGRLEQAELHAKEAEARCAKMQVDMHSSVERESQLQHGHESLFAKTQQLAKDLDEAGAELASANGRIEQLLAGEKELEIALADAQEELSAAADRIIAGKKREGELEAIIAQGQAQTEETGGALRERDASLEREVQQRLAAEKLVADIGGALESANAKKYVGDLQDPGLM